MPGSLHSLSCLAAKAGPTTVLPFSCRFSQLDELCRHKRSHSGVKLYQCAAACEKKFARTERLAKHVKIHRGQPYGQRMLQTGSRN